MGSTLWEVRRLVDGLYDTDPADWAGGLVEPWLGTHAHVVDELRDVGRPESRRVRVAPDPNHWTALEGLYALSRAVDVLLLPHQPAHPEWIVTPDGDLWPGTGGAPAWGVFSALIGAVPVAAWSFHPFFHEIVPVEPRDDPDEPPSVVGEYWPGALVGSLLLARAGVAIRAGRNHVRPDVAATSCLYWTHRRQYRDTTDLAEGWGHNSQWRTNARRDYVTEGHAYYNVDARGSRGRDEELEEADRLDLLRHRCSVRTDLGRDAWPYDETLVEAVP